MATGQLGSTTICAHHCLVAEAHSLGTLMMCNNRQLYDNLINIVTRSYLFSGPRR